MPARDEPDGSDTGGSGTGGGGTASSVARAWTPLRAVKLAAAIALVPVSLCAPSGDWAWREAWLVLLLQSLPFAAASLYIARTNPGLFVERERFLRHPNVAPWDRALVPGVVGLTPLMYVAAGLQHRQQLAGPLGAPPAAGAGRTAAAALLELAAVAVECWAICANRFFSSVVRIQHDRRDQPGGQTVCSWGPYALVRHPAYSGFVLQAAAEAALLRSSWCLLLGAARSALLLVRTAKEDAMLQQELQGYGAYAARVRYRLLPPVW